MCGNLTQEIDGTNLKAPEGATAALDQRWLEATSPQRAAGFNYGAPLPYDPLNPIIRDGHIIAAQLSIKAQEASRLAWAHEMATRAYRIAETAEEREAAAIRLAALNSQYKGLGAD